MKTPQLQAFLILGAQRSGTSLLTRILNQHSVLAVPPESFFFNTFVPLSRYYGELSIDSNLIRFIDDVVSTPKVQQMAPGPTPEQVLGRLTERTMGGVFRALHESWAISKGKSIWGEKTPHHVFYWPEISRSFPNVPLVHIVRDGRDVARGLIKARFGPKSAYAAALRWARWADQIELIRAQVPVERFYQISYEELLARPEEAVTGICCFLGVPFEPRMLDFHLDRSHYSDYAAEHSNLNRPLLSEKIAEWKRSMKPSEVALVESVAGTQLRRYGYELRTGAVPLNAIQRGYYSWIDHPPRKALAMLRNRPGHREEFALMSMRARIRARSLFSPNN